MFDLITGKTKHMPSGGPVTVLLSTALHVIVLSAVLIVPLLFVTDVVPKVPTMLAFVAAPPPEPPPPPPPPPPPQARATDVQPKGTTSSLNAAPVEAPSKIEPELAGPESGEGEAIGGVEGGIPGGVVGGMVGGLLAASLPPPPPPPPPPPTPREPVRIGGEIHPPVLVQRVEPIYPDLALNARIQGMVILEAIIEEDGNVSHVKVLSAPRLLDKAAVAAVEQWRYAPVMLNGRPVRCILTVSESFRIPPA
jgi:periplasmic protein TonB